MSLLFLSPLLFHLSDLSLAAHCQSHYAEEELRIRGLSPSLEETMFHEM